MSLFAQLVIALALFAGGLATGIKYELGVVARRDLAAAQAAESDRLQQRKFGDKAATTHATELARINNQLGDAREKIAALSGRECLDADTVGMLNDIGDKPMRAPASEPAGSTAALASGDGLRFATERDAAGAIAICRARYTEVSSQIDQILDIEDKRHPP